MQHITISITSSLASKLLFFRWLFVFHIFIPLPFVHKVMLFLLFQEMLEVAGNLPSILSTALVPW